MSSTTLWPLCLRTFRSGMRRIAWLPVLASFAPACVFGQDLASAKLRTVNVFASDLSPLATIPGFVALALATGACAAVWMLRPTLFHITLDGVRHSYLLRPFGAVPLKDNRGTTIADLRRRWGRPRVVTRPGTIYGPLHLT